MSELANRLRELAQAFNQEAKRLEVLESSPYRSGSNQVCDRPGETEVADPHLRMMMDNKINPEADVDHLVKNIVNNPTAQLRLIAKHDVAEFKLRKRVERLEQFDRRIIGLDQAFYKENQGRRSVEAAHSAAISELDKLETQNKSLIKTLFALVEKQNVNISNINRAHNEINQQVNEGWIRSSLEQLKQENLGLARQLSTATKQLKAVQSRLAKDWDKKRR